MTTLTTVRRSSSDQTTDASRHAPIQANYRITILYQRGDCLAVSEALNRAAQRVINDLWSCFIQSNEFKGCWTILHSQPKNCGKTETASAALQGMSALEQMFALAAWFFHGQHSVREHKYTLCLSNNSNRLSGKKIPLSIQKGATSLMEVMLGTRSQEYPALRYDELAARDPWKDHKTENFIYHLEALEMVRQPQYSAATLIKGNAFESDYIDEAWRYGTTGPEACVEIPGQNKLSKKNQATRTQSAAYNLFKLMDSGLGDIELCDHSRCFSKTVSPDTILEAYKSGEEALCHQMSMLTFAKMGPFSSSTLQAFGSRLPLVQEESI